MQKQQATNAQTLPL